MDGLNDEERILAWKTSWNPSFAGVAIINKDFTFRSVNPQFCKLLGVTPADLVGQKFQDITPPQIRELDQKNAKMVMDGLIDYYILPKKYEFPNGKKTSVVLLVTRAPLSHEGEFQFFVSRIMLNEGGEQKLQIQDQNVVLEQSSQISMKTVTELLVNNIKLFIAIGASIAAIYYGFLEFFEKND